MDLEVKLRHVSHKYIAKFIARYLNVVNILNLFLLIFVINYCGI